MSNTIVYTGFGIHGYQPPRRKDETTVVPYWDAQRGSVDDELIVDPFNGESKDYTKQISDKCYTPAASCGVLALMGAYDFSPQLLSYLGKREPATYSEVIASDKASMENFGGNGSAIMQGSYYHLILPFERWEIKDTQVYWAKAAFKEHFGREPEGAWLPEAAVDLDTLDILADYGIKFTVLAPWQIKKVRKIGNDNWGYVGSAVDPSKIYKCNVRNGRSIAIFVFDDPLADKIANNKDGIYTSPLHFHEHVKQTRDYGFTCSYNDIETLNWHHSGTLEVMHKSLVGLFQEKPTRGNATYRLTNFARFLREHPPEYEAEIEPWTSWSCKEGGRHHFLGRWGDLNQKDECKCGEVINSDWRAALREAHTYLNHKLEDIYFGENGLGRLYFQDPRRALKEYIYVVMERENLFNFLKRHTNHNVLTSNFENAYNLLEAMRLSMIMNTSCGWFHNGILRIEPVINMVSANSAIKALHIASGNGVADKLRGEFLALMSKVPTMSLEKGGKRIQSGREAFEFAVEKNTGASRDRKTVLATK